MTFHLSMSEITGNAFIEALKGNQYVNYLTYREIADYALAVLDLLGNEGDDHYDIAPGRDFMAELLRDYPDCFADDTDGGIRLKPGITRYDLIGRFRGYLTIPVLRAYTNPDAAKKVRRSPQYRNEVINGFKNLYEL